MERRWQHDARHVAPWGRWLFWSGDHWQADERLLHMTRTREYLRTRADALVRDTKNGKIKWGDELDREKALKCAEALAKQLRAAPMVNNHPGAACAGAHRIRRPRRRRSGAAAPRARVGATEAYVLERETLVSTRDLAVVWRRLRRLVRRGPATELDVEATLQRQSRDGVLTHVALRPRRHNTARLLLLIDVSPSMAPWQGFLANLAASLPLSRLRHVEAFYFTNVPRHAIFRTSGLDDPVELDSAFFAARLGSALLVLSDAGAARARFSRGRLNDSRAFLRRAAADLAPIVWLNPLPVGRWPRTTAQALTRERRATFLPLSDAMLIRAADLLRGAKAA
jgi:uncharacterized protein with von Willebrand factor type A (vWA) domain